MNENTMVIENPEIIRVREITQKLEQVNQEVERLLDRLPLNHHNEVARLNLLINEQMRLVDVSRRRLLPPRVTVFFENAQDRASFLQRRYNDAIRKGELRKPEGTE